MRRTASTSGATTLRAQNSTVKKPAPPQLKKTKSMVGQSSTATSAGNGQSPRNPAAAPQRRPSGAGAPTTTIATSAPPSKPTSTTLPTAASNGSSPASASTATDRYTQAAKSVLKEKQVPEIPSLSTDETEPSPEATTGKYVLTPDGQRLTLVNGIDVQLSRGGKMIAIEGGSSSGLHSSWDAENKVATVALQASPLVNLATWALNKESKECPQCLQVATAATRASGQGDEQVTELVQKETHITARHSSGIQSVLQETGGTLNVSLGGDVKLIGTRNSGAGGSKQLGSAFPLQGDISGTLSAGSLLKVSGQWSQGARAGQGSVKAQGNLNFEGAWLDDRRHGVGVLTFPATSNNGVDSNTFTAQATGTWSLGRLSGCPQICVNPTDDTPSTYYSSSADGAEVSVKMDTGLFKGSWSENPRELFGVRPLNVSVVGKEKSAQQAAALKEVSAGGTRLVALAAACHLQTRLTGCAGRATGLDELGPLLSRQKTLQDLQLQLASRASQVAELQEEAKRLASNKKRLLSRLASGEEQVKKAEGTVKTFQDQNTKDLATKSRIEADVAKEEASLESLAKFMEAKKNGSQSAPGDMSPEDELSQLQTNISKVSATLRDLSNDIRNLKTKKETLTREIPGLEDDIKAAQSHLAKCDDAMVSATEKAESQREQYEKLVAQSHDGSSEALGLVDELALQVEKLAAEYEELKDSIKTAQLKKEARVQQQNHLKAELINLDLQVADIRVSIDSVEDEVLTTGAQVEEQLVVATEMDQELTVVQHTIQGAKDELKYQQKEEDRLMSELKLANNEARKGYQNPESLKEKYEKSIANFNSRIDALGACSESDVSRSPTPPPKADPDEAELKSLQEAVTQYLTQTDESYTEKRMLQRRLDTAAQNSTKYREKIKKLEDKLERENSQKDTAFTGTADDLKRLLKETKKENDEASAALADLKNLVVLKQSDFERAKSEEQKLNSSGLSRSGGATGDNRIKLLQEEADRRDGVISQLRVRVKRVHVLESKLDAARDQATALSQAHSVRQQSGLRRQSSALGGW